MRLLIAVFVAIIVSRLPQVGGRVRTATLFVAVALGLYTAVSHASVVDDAFTAFRYSRHLLDGDGLVFNTGERVEGYTDLLWVLLVAAGTWLTGVELPLVAVVLDLLAFIGNLLVVSALARRLRPDGPPGLPVAAILLALHHAFTSHATTGLETQLATLLIGLGAYALVVERPFAAGIALILATTTRPDAAIFYVAGAACLLRAPRELVRYSVPFLGYLALTLWRYSYYGDVVPNTYWAKSANLAYYSQGFVYLSDFWLSSQGWVLLLVWLGWLTTETSPRLRVFTAIAIPAQIVYVARIGGDFMSGRFFVCLVPLLLVAAEDLFHRLSAGGARRSRARSALAGLIAFTALATPLLAPKKVRWFLADEGTVYPLVGVDPVRVDHGSWQAGMFLKRTLTDRGIRPVLATGTIGMISYYSMLPLIDLHGLTDRTVARVPLKQRGHPGHEKIPPNSYLRKRRVNIVQSSFCGMGERAALTELRPSQRQAKPWCIFIYDRVLFARIRDEAPEWSFVDFELWLDRYIATLDSRSADVVVADLAWFREYYFDYNDDPARLGRIEGWVSAHVSPKPAAVHP